MSVDLDQLLRDARALEPAPTSERDDESAIARAVLAGGARHARQVRRQRVLGAIAALAAAAAIVLAVRVGPEATAPAAPEIVELTLPSGDRLEATSDARFDVTSSEPALRRITLTRGAMLFDVAPLRGGAFEVRTPDATVSVRGTIFVVEVGDHGTSVQVIEGRVDVDGQLLVARGSVHAERASERTRTLAARGEVAATRRRSRPPAIEPPPSAPVASAIQPPAPRSAVPPEAHGTARPIAQRTQRPRPEQVLVREQAEEPPRAADEALTIARARLREGHADAALALAHDGVGAEWRMIEADALRRLGRDAEAADAYDRAAGEPAAARSAGYLAAELRLRRLADPAGALASLDASGADDEGSPLRERALALRASALERLGREADLAATARTYVAAFPEGPRASWMRERAR